MKLCEKCNDRPISENKSWCLQCIEEAAANNVSVRDEPAAEGATHILVSRNGVMTDDKGRSAGFKAHDLYRADGLLIASRQDDIVRYGDDISTARNHIFLNDASALAFLKRLADVDLVCQREGVFIHTRVYIYANPELCPVAAVFDARTEDDIEVQGPNGKIVLATPGNRHSLKM